MNDDGSIKSWEICPLRYRPRAVDIDVQLKTQRKDKVELLFFSNYLRGRLYMRM